MKFILLINVKMPTIVGISTFDLISRIHVHAVSESLKQKNFSFYKQVKFYALLIWG